MGSITCLWPLCLRLRLSPGLCSKKLQPGWFTWMYLHTPHVLPQLPGAAQQEDFCAPIEWVPMASSSRAGPFSGDPSQWSHCVQPCPSEWGTKHRLWELPCRRYTWSPSVQQKSFNSQIFQKKNPKKTSQTNKQQQQEQNRNPTDLCQLAQYFF